MGNLNPMQSGKSHTAIVQSMEGLSFYRNHHITEMKKAAHRRHRNRVRQDLKLMARGVIDPDEFEDQPIKSEALDTWDVW